jgi:asparagine synthase (glutamine-hydrolysing)
MCGVAGILNLNQTGVDPLVLRRMIQAVSHRGPDDSGLFMERHVGLAHSRLSILDPAGGHQPMANKDKTLWITFNGEIFNYLEIKEQLAKKGHRFATRSDTEVILHLYETYGEDCVHELNGQWAFAIWDRRTTKLFLSRDRLGMMPLFYTVADRSFRFASEIKAIFADLTVRRDIDLVALDQLFTFWTTLAPRTIFNGIRELPPGHSLTVQGEEVRVWPYWRLNYDHCEEERSANDYAERLSELLADATRIRLRSDVPVGSYLSGGLDSAVVTALMKRLTNRPLKTFSIAFNDPEYDESVSQKKVVDFLQTDHRELRCSYRDIGRVFPDVVWHTEKPILRTAPAPFFLLSRLVHDEGHKVILTGEGADEMFGGYDIFKEAKIRQFCNVSPASRMRPVLLKRLYPYLQSLQAVPEAYLKAFFNKEPGDRSEPFFSHVPRWELTRSIKLFFSAAVKSEVHKGVGYDELESLLPPRYFDWDNFSKAQYLESFYLLPGYILSSQGDRMTMAHSVEARFPFLDHRVVELATGMPARFKMKVLQEKYILRRAAAALVPRDVMSRPKQPYRAPDSKTFFGDGAGNPADYVQELLSPARVQADGIFNPIAVQKLVEKARRGQIIGARDNMALVGILSTQLVMDKFIRNFAGRRQHGFDRTASTSIHC